MKIKTMSLSLNEKGLKKSVGEYDCTKTKTGYVVEKPSNFGGKTTRVKNSEILKK